MILRNVSGVIQDICYKRVRNNRTVVVPDGTLYDKRLWCCIDSIDEVVQDLKPDKKVKKKTKRKSKFMEDE